MRIPLHRSWPWWLLCGLLLLTWLAYRPGLSGGFLFDDLVNLPALGATGPIDDWPTFWRYITSGIADPLGRPIALLSFLIDARTWPADPAPFLRTNVLLHLCNGGLLFLLLRRLGRGFGDSDARSDAAALLGAGLWLLHPLFVSTTLYIVQREAMLPATFVLLGLLAWLHGRDQFSHGCRRSGTAWMLAGIVGGTLLGTLCKANGILLPLLAWVLEATVLRERTPSAPVAQRSLSRLHRLLFGLPMLALALLLAKQLTHLNHPIAMRPWTIGQRLLTEPRVLLDYLQLLVVPRVLSPGLFNENYPFSTGLLQPASTLPALLAVAGLLWLGWRLRRSAPAWAAAILFFLAGHSLESTSIPLELFFEHRNYLPALLLFWPVARALCAWRTKIGLRALSASALLLLMAAITWQRAELWGHPDRMALLWARSNPDSFRAQAAAAATETTAGKPQLAIQRLLPLWRQHPDDLQLGLNYINAACSADSLDREDIASIGVTLRTANQQGLLLYQWLENALDVAAKDQCPGLRMQDVSQWLDDVADNPHMGLKAGRQQSLEYLWGRLALLRHEPDQALKHFDLAISAKVTPDVAAQQTALLAASGYYRQALNHLDNYERLKHRTQKPPKGMPQLHAKVLEWQGYWPRELAILRSKLHAEIDAREQ